MDFGGIGAGDRELNVDGVGTLIRGHRTIHARVRVRRARTANQVRV
jgi:hypothetical protein